MIVDQNHKHPIITNAKYNAVLGIALAFIKQNWLKSLMIKLVVVHPYNQTVGLLISYHHSINLSRCYSTRGNYLKLIPECLIAIISNHI